MKIIIDIPRERLQGYAAIYKTFSQDPPSDIDEVVEKACNTESVSFDLMDMDGIDKKEGKQIEFALAMMAMGQIGLKGDKK